MKFLLAALVFLHLLACGMSVEIHATEEAKSSCTDINPESCRSLALVGYCDSRRGIQGSKLPFKTVCCASCQKMEKKRKTTVAVPPTTTTELPTTEVATAESVVSPVTEEVAEKTPSPSNIKSFNLIDSHYMPSKFQFFFSDFMLY
jgi:hypothetical protein